MPEYVVGRNPDPTVPRVVVSGDQTVSSTHCRITVLGDGTYKLDDLQSRNHTFVKEPGGWRLVVSSRVKATDPIMLGKYVTTVADLLRNVQEVKHKVRVTRNPKTGEIEHR